MSKLEKNVQSEVIDLLKKEGYFVIKLIQTNMTGIPDILAIPKVVKNKKDILWIECKREVGGILSPLQNFKINTLNMLGMTAFSCNDAKKIPQMIKNRLA